MNNRIKSVREVLNLSQREFGEKLGVSRDVISNLEYNRVQPKERFLHHMCQQYGVNEHWLSTGEGNMFDNNCLSNQKVEQTITILKSLRPEFQDFALDHIMRLAELQSKIQ